MTDDATTAGLRDEVFRKIDDWTAVRVVGPKRWAFDDFAKREVAARMEMQAALTAYGDRRAAVARRDALAEADALEGDTDVIASLLRDAEKALEADGKQA